MMLFNLVMVVLGCLALFLALRLVRRGKVCDMDKCYCMREIDLETLDTASPAPTLPNDYQI